MDGVIVTFVAQFNTKSIINGLRSGRRISEYPDTTIFLPTPENRRKKTGRRKRCRICNIQQAAAKNLG